MIDFTVKQLSETYRLSIDIFLEELKSAGIKGKSADSILSKEEKSTLIEYIKGKRKSSSKISVLTARPRLVRVKIAKKANIAIEIKHKKNNFREKITTHRSA